MITTEQINQKFEQLRAQKFIDKYSLSEVSKMVTPNLSDDLWLCRGNDRAQVLEIRKFFKKINAYQFVNYYGKSKAKELRATTCNALLDMRHYQLHVDDIDQALLDIEIINLLGGLSEATIKCDRAEKEALILINIPVEKGFGDIFVSRVRETINRVNKGLKND